LSRCGLDFRSLLRENPRVQTSIPLTLSRREALRMIFTAAALASALDITVFGVEGGLGADPDLLKKEIPWPRIMTEVEKRAAAALADVLIPEDEHGPAASAVGVVDFIDEWISAPYDTQQRDAKVIRTGLAWLDAESTKRFEKVFAEATGAQQIALIEDIIADGTDARKKAFSFWKLFRDRSAGAYYSTPLGWKAIGYTGNTPLSEFPGATPEALKHLGLA
jgi:hypothetical protein